MTKTKDFETAIEELESVVNELDGEIKLEAALDLFERGMKLSRECEQFLKGAQQKVEMLKRSTDGVIETEPFADLDDTPDKSTGLAAEEQKESAVTDAQTDKCSEGERPGIAPENS